jgi:hypothetical protein
MRWMLDKFRLTMTTILAALTPAVHIVWLLLSYVRPE